MACVETLPCTCVEPSDLERVRYFPRQLLTADDMRVEQEYFRERQRRHNRFLHGWGVVCGLEVRVDAEAGPLAVQICPGYALDPQGDEIYVPHAVPIDLGECARPDASPCLPALSLSAASRAALSADTAPPRIVAIQIRYAECPTRPVRTLPAGCSCDETACEYSRIRDGFEIRCVDKPAATGVTTKDAPPTLCETEKDRKGRLPPYRDIACDPWIELAAVTLKKPATVGASITIDAAAVDNGTRRIVYSGATVQDQVIRCCCQ